MRIIIKKNDFGHLMEIYYGIFIKMKLETARKQVDVHCTLYVDDHYIGAYLVVKVAFNYTVI